MQKGPGTWFNAPFFPVYSSKHHGAVLPNEETVRPVISSSNDASVDSKFGDTLPEAQLSDIEVAVPSQRAEYISNVKIYATYDARIEKDHYTAWLSKISDKKKLGIADISFRYQNTCFAYQRTHVLIVWTDRFRSRSASVLDYDGVRPEIRYIKDMPQLNKVMALFVTLSPI